MPLDFDEAKDDKRIDDLHKKEEEELVQILAQAKYDIPYINLLTTTIENEALRFITEPEARQLEVAPFQIVGKKLNIAVRSPIHEGLDVFLEKIKSEGFDPIVYMASEASLEKAWSRYKELSFASESRTGGLDISNDTLAETAGKVSHIGDVPRIVEESMQGHKTHKISRLLEIVLAGAIAINASDIHIEPEESRTRLRYRLDGVLQDVMFFDLDIFKLLNSRIKLLSGLKITIHDKAQDGRYSIFIGGEEINIRTSLIPGAYGESIVMRLLNPKSIRVKLEDMGIDPKLFTVIKREISKPNGLILLTGPTGSGKTTTLYAFLQHIYSAEIKIITIEDPIEYHLPGLTQTQTEKGYTFLEGLRSALRQDPDVIMVGEIRDSETAKTAIESALTGHLVFSTLHTNDAAGVIPRLIDLDVNPKILVSALSLSIAQRLVRKLCASCKSAREPSPEDETLIRTILQNAVALGKDLSSYNVTPDQKIVIYEAPGCATCNNTGYSGRMGIFEAIQTDAEIEKIITVNPSDREIKKIAAAQGLLDMREDGIIKILAGSTSLSEVKSVVDLYEK